MMTYLYELVNPLNTYALAVVLVCCTSFAAAVFVKKVSPETETVSFSFNFGVVGVFFKIGYSTFKSLSISGHIESRYLNLDALVLLVLFSFVMGSSMYVIDLKRRLEQARRVNKEAITIIARAKQELESINGRSRRP